MTTKEQKPGTMSQTKSENKEQITTQNSHKTATTYPHGDGVSNLTRVNQNRGRRAPLAKEPNQLLGSLHTAKTRNRQEEDQKRKRMENETKKSKALKAYGDIGELVLCLLHAVDAVVADASKL